MFMKPTSNKVLSYRFSLSVRVTNIHIFFLSLATDLRLENSGVEELDKILIDILFEVEFIVFRLVVFIILFRIVNFCC